MGHVKKLIRFDNNPANSIQVTLITRRGESRWGRGENGGISYRDDDAGDRGSIREEYALFYLDRNFHFAFYFFSLPN